MKKNRGFMFVELIVILGIFIVIIFPMIMLMNKNIKIVENIRINNEIIKTAENIENILINLSEKEEISDKYFLDFDKKEKTAVLKSSGGGELTKLRDIKYISLCEITVSQKKIFFQEEGIEKEFGKAGVIKIKIGTDEKIKEIEKVLAGNLYEKYEYKQ